MRRRFFVERFDGRSAVLRGSAVHHLGRVLRAERGQLYELSDGQVVWLARTECVNRDAVEFALLEPLPARAPRFRTLLLLAIVKFDCLEWGLEKATELGASEITLLAAARTEKALIGGAVKRAARWKKILFEAAQQSRQLRPPTLHPCLRPCEAFGHTQAEIKILFSERPDAPTLRTVVSSREKPGVASAAAAIGPEGGWTEEELSAARSAGFVEVSLGANILRTETAVAAALAALNYALGD